MMLRCIVVLLLALPTLAHAQTPTDTSFFFYRPVKYGSASILTPASIFANRGFSIVTIGDRYPRDLRDITWRKSTFWVVETLKNPFDAIERFGGWDKWIRTHFIPFAGIPLDQAGWFPNYVGHIMHGGQSYRYMSEYFEAHGTPLPRATAALMYMTMAFANEVIEQQGHEVIAAATPADLYIFDPAAILVFEIDAVARFFSKTLRAADWSPMPSLTLPNGEVQNNGQVVTYRARLPYVSEMDAILIIGLSGQLGVMKEIGAGNSMGGAVGLAGGDRTVDPVTQQEHVNLVVSYGAYWDRNNSLLASMVYSPRAKNEVAVNVYPGVLPGIAKPLGAWLVRTNDGKIRIGVATARTLGLGIGYGR